MLLLACSSNDPTPPTITLQATTEVIALGQSSQLRWQVSGSEPITLSLSPENDAPLNSPLTVSPIETTTYTLTANNSAGSDSASVTITVTDEPTISAFDATPAEGAASLTVTFNWTLNVAAGCTVDPGNGDTQTFEDCSATQQTTYTYDQAGTFEASLTLENGNTQSTTVTVLPADDTVTVGGFVAEQSRNVVIILTDEDQPTMTVDSLNRAIADVATSLGANDTPSVRGANAALLGLLAQQDTPTENPDDNQITETEQLFSLVGDFVVAVDSRGQVIGSSQLTPDMNSVRFDLDIPADTTVALLLAAADGQGGWFCKGSLEYQVVADQTTTSSQQTLYRFPASLVNNPRLQAGRFVFNELTGQPAALLEGNTSSMIGDVPDEAVIDAIITPEDAPAFADGVYRLCANENAVQTNVLADLDWQSDAFTDDTIAEGESTVYDYALALLIGEQNGQRRLLGSAPINPDGTLRVPLTYAGSINAQLVMTDVAFFDADKQQFPLTPSYAFAENVQAAETNATDIDLRQQGGGLAYISGNVVTSSGGAVAGATVIMVVDGERLAFNVATADDNGFFELLIPTSDEAYILYAQNPAATLGGIASNDNTGVRYVVDDEASINQDITLNVPINSDIDPSTRPEVSAGSDVAVLAGRTVRLQGRASDPDGDALNFRWEVLSQPAGSDLILSDADSDAVTFTPEQVGDYVLRFTASDGRILAADLVTVRVLPNRTTSVSSVQFTNAPTFAELVEGGDGYTLELSRSGTANEPLTVRLQLAEDNTSEPDEIRLEGTTRDGTDYLVTFEAGQVRTTITVFAREDDTPESADLLVLELADADAYTLGNTTQASFVISDAPNPIDPPPPAPSSRCEGSRTVRQAADLTDLTRCQEITGDLTIDPLEPLSLQQTGDITSLAPLANLQTILGNLTIRNTLLESLTGVDNLQQIGGNLVLNNNTILTDLSAIATLTDNDITGNVIINGNSSLDCPAQNLAFTVNASTDNLVNCNEPPDPIDPVVDAPVITAFTATPEEIEAGQSSLLEWMITGTAPITLTLEGGATTQNVSAQTSLTVNPTVTTDYILTATNSADEVQVTATVTVNPTATTCEGDYLVTSQADLDNLATCTVITGNLVLEDTPITDLTPLVNLTSIGGSLLIRDNQNLLNLAGLENLTNVGGGLDIDNNPLLTSLEPLSNLQTIGGFLDIDDTALTDLTGLGSLTSIGGTLFFNTNSQLSSLTGLERLTSIGGYLEIFGNPLLTSLNGLEALTSIGGNVYIGFDFGGNRIFGNATLADLSAIADLTDADIAGIDRVVTGNPALDCLAQNLGFTVTVSEGNLVNCVGSLEVCGNAGESIIVGSQTELNALATCREILGSLFINGIDIVTLEPLSNLTAIGDTLSIANTFNLINTTGLENLTSVQSINIDSNRRLEDISALANISGTVDSINIRANDSLTNLTGLGGITTVETTVSIVLNGGLTTLAGLAVTEIGDGLSIDRNPALTDLTGLDNLVSTGRLNIFSNDALSSLAALSNLTSVVEIIIVDNDSPLLRNLTGLDNVTTANSLLIDVNDGLVDLTGLGGITTVPGEVVISGNQNLSSLAGLAVTSVGSNRSGNTLTIRGNPALNDISALATLTDVFGSLIISGNDSLVSLAPLAMALTRVSSSLTITNNALLASLDGLQNITEFGNSVSITVSDNPLLDCSQPTPTPTLSFEVGVSSGNLVNCGDMVLRTCDDDYTIDDISYDSRLDLSTCEEITGSLTINTALIDNVDFLSNLVTLGGDLTLLDSTNLRNLTGFSNLTNFTGDLLIDNIDAFAPDLTGLAGITTPNNVTLRSGSLTSLAGLNLITVTGDLTLTAIPGVRDFASLTSLTSVGGNLQLENLDFADLSFLTNLTSVGGDITIFNNDRTSFTSLAGIENIMGYNDANTVTVSDNGFLDCTPPPTLPFTVDFSTNNAVDCIPAPCAGDYTVTNQAELDALASCNEITGFLQIDGSTDIANLDALTNLTTLGGGLTLRANTALTNVGGLANLSSFGGDNLRIENNDALTSLNGLGGITSVFNFNIESNLLLPDLTGLDSLTTVTGIFFIFNNDALSNLAALANVTSVTSGQIVIWNNPNLPNLTGLGGITSAPADLLIENNANLTTLAGLAVTDIGGGLVILNNPLLNDISALASLNSIGDFGGVSLRVDNNDALTSIAPLGSLFTVPRDIQINGNATLANLNGLQNITGYADVANTVTVSNNASLNCSQPIPTPTLLFTVDTSTGNAVNCP
jgi:PKD repeat protein